MKCETPDTCLGVRPVVRIALVFHTMLFSTLIRSRGRRSEHSDLKLQLLHCTREVLQKIVSLYKTSTTVCDRPTM